MQNTEKKAEKQDRLFATPQLPPEVDISTLKEIECELYSIAISQLRRDKEEGIYDPMFRPYRLVGKTMAQAEVIFEDPEIFLKYGIGFLLHLDRDADSTWNRLLSPVILPSTKRELFYPDNFDRFHDLIVFPFVSALIERELRNGHGVKKYKEINECVHLLNGIISKERDTWYNSYDYRFRAYRYEFILNFVNKHPANEKLEHLVKKRAQLENQIALLESSPNDLSEDSKNEIRVLKLVSRRLKIEIKKTKSLKSVSTPVQQLREPNTDCFETRIPLTETPPAPTAVPEPEEAPKLNLPQLALLYIYQEEILTKVKACSIAVDKGYKTGEAFWRDYQRLEMGTSYRTQEKVSIKNINKVLPYLISNPAAYAWANKELDVAIRYRDDGFLK